MRYCPNCGYKLDETTPISSQGETPPQNASGEVLSSVLEGYEGRNEEKVTKTPKTAPGIAQSKVFDYRERFKQKKLRPSELVAPTSYLTKLPKQDADLDKFNFHGESLFFGDGTVQEA